MIYIEKDGDFVRQTKFDKEIEILEGLFPNFRTTGGVKIKVAKGVAKYAPVYRPHETDNPIRTMRIQTPASLTSAKVNYVGLDGVRREVIYTKSAPSTDKAGNKIFNLKRFKLEDDMVLSGAVDLEKIVFLFFYSNEFTNGALKRENARYQFDIPSVRAKAKSSEIAEKAKYAAEIVAEDTRKDYKWVLSMFNTLGIVSTNVEEDDRLALYDRVTDSNAVEFKSKYQRAKDNLEALSKRDGTNKIDELTNLVKELEKTPLLKQKDGYWITKIGDEERTLCHVVGEKAADKRLSLVEWLITQPNEEADLKSLLK